MFVGYVVFPNPSSKESNNAQDPFHKVVRRLSKKHCKVEYVESLNGFEDSCRECFFFSRTDAP